jgi:cytochrome c553
MNNKFAVAVGTVAMFLTTSTFAGQREDLLAQYATTAKAASSGFTAFSAARGKTLHTQAFAAGKADTPACTSCHGDDPRSPGRSRTGKAIESMAASLVPSRYSDPAKVEKWFKRNCNEVLGRECTPQEKGDWLAYMFSQ